MCGQVRRLDTLWPAWIAVRSKALHSRNKETASDAQRVEENPVGALRAIHVALHYGLFEFSLQKGVVKKRKGKKPRPLVVAPVRNRIVQRAILDTLQSEKTRVRRRLGQIPDILATPTSVGAIPGRGAPDAVRIIRESIDAGATDFIRSDIRDFFTRVPTERLIEFMREQTEDDAFTALVERGVAVELANADDPRVSEWIDLFPDGEVGVPQGCSLSALCANVVLKDFDHELNQRGITTVRYIDDFVILGSKHQAVEKAWHVAVEILKGLGLEAHSPIPGGTKASSGRIDDGFEFLSYHFRGRTVGLARNAKTRLLGQIDQDFADARKTIAKQMREVRRAQSRFVQTLDLIDRKVRGWGDSFRDVDQRVEFAQLDDQIAEKISRFTAWYFGQTKGCDTRTKMRAMGVALLVDTPHGNLAGRTSEFFHPATS